MEKGNKEALIKIQRYCAYQERCHQDVRLKLLDIGIRGNELEDIIVELIQDNYLNEERYAKSYASGKFKIKKWGRNKIIHELRKRKVSEYCINRGLQEIEENEYKATLVNLLQKKLDEEKEFDPFKKKRKIAHYLASRGFENEMIWEYLNHAYSAFD